MTDPEARSHPDLNETLGLATLAISMPGDSVVAEGEALPEGARVGPYRIVHMLGHGGMGEVYLADQTQPVQRQVALKLLRGRVLGSRQVAHFAIEVQLLARMRHPAIAQVFDAGTTAQGHPYFAMEYVEGEPLTRFCDDHGLDLRQRLELFVRICQGVQHAHQKGVIHLDLKPGNILVAEVDGVPSPKIIDFGVALTERSAREDGTVAAGTPEYMSPEQAGLVDVDVDIRSDVFALGVILYELLTDSRPLASDWFRSGAAAESMSITPPSVQLSGRVVELVTVARRRRLHPLRLVRLLRRELDWVVLRATRPLRDERYASAALLADDIRAFLERRPVSAVPSSRLYRLRTFVARHRLGLSAAAAIALAVLVGLAAAIGGFVRASAERDRAEQALALAEAVNTFLVDDLLGSADIEVSAAGGEVTVRQILAQASATASERFEGRPLVEAGVRFTLGTSLRGLGDRSAAEAEFQQALELRRQHLGADHADTLQTAHRLASVMHQLGRFDEAGALYRDTWERQLRAFGENDAGTIASRNSLGVLAWQVGQMEEGVEHAEAALAQARAHLGEDHRETLIARNNLGRLYRAQERFEESELMLKAALAGRARLYGDDSVLTLESRNDLAGLYRGTGRLTEAAELFESVVASHRRTAGLRHSGTLVAMNNLARTYGNLGRHDEAVALYREVLEHAPDALPPDHWLVAMFSMNLGESLTALGAFDEAETLLHWAHQRLVAVFDADDPRARAAEQRLRLLGEAREASGH
jgi:eukaryotic-like serine/threonine-protein kinase